MTRAEREILTIRDLIAKHGPGGDCPEPFKLTPHELATVIAHHAERAQCFIEMAEERPVTELAAEIASLADREDLVDRIAAILLDEGITDDELDQMVIVKGTAPAEPGWHQVADTLPPNASPVLVWIWPDQATEIGAYHYLAREWSIAGGLQNVHVTHWRELPEAPLGVLVIEPDESHDRSEAP